MRRTIVVAALVAALVVALGVAPAGAHTHRQLHQTIASLRANDRAQANQIASLRARVRFLEDTLFSETAGLVCYTLDADKLTWDNLNAEPNLTLAYPVVNGCSGLASTSLPTSLSRSLEQQMERVEGVTP
jgi:hypothetical protein